MVVAEENTQSNLISLYSSLYVNVEWLMTFLFFLKHLQ